MTQLIYNLKDTDNNPVFIGDKIEVILPQIDNWNPEYQSDSFWVDERSITGTLHFWMSRGLMVKIETVTDYEGELVNGKPYTRVGQWIPLKQKTWEWWKIGDATKEFNYKLHDSAGKQACFGDTVRVTLPPMTVDVVPDDAKHPVDSTEALWPDYVSLKASERIVEGFLFFQLSKGALFKVTRMIQDCPTSPGYANAGKVFKFKSKGWQWYKTGNTKTPFSIEIEPIIKTAQYGDIELQKV